MKKDTSVIITICIALTAVAITMFTMVYRSWHPEHSYDAADLIRDTKYCESVGLNIKLVMFPSRDPSSTWVQGATCQTADGTTVFIPNNVQESRK